MQQALLRDYQQEAVDAIAHGLANGGRGQLHAACGSGKTLMSIHAALRLLPNQGLAVVLVGGTRAAAMEYFIEEIEGTTYCIMALGVRDGTGAVHIDGSLQKLLDPNILSTASEPGA